MIFKDKKYISCIRARFCPKQPDDQTVAGRKVSASLKQGQIQPLLVVPMIIRNAHIFQTLLMQIFVTAFPALLKSSIEGLSIVVNKLTASVDC